MPIGPITPADQALPPIAARAAAQLLVQPGLRDAALPGEGEAKIAVLRPAPLPPVAPIPKPTPAAVEAASPPAANDRFQASPALVGMRESRAMALLAADLAGELAVAGAGEVESLRTRLREVVEIGSARDTAGPLAALYAAARRDGSTPLARLLGRDGGIDAGTAMEAVRDLRALDERFAVRDFALAPAPALQPATLPAAATTRTIDLTA